MATAKSIRTVWTAGVVLVGLLPAAQAQETLAGVGAAGGIAAGMGAISATSIRPGDVTRRMPDVSGRGMEGGDAGDPGAGGGGTAAGGVAAPAFGGSTRSVRFNSISGQTLVNELVRSGGIKRPSTTSRKVRSPRAQAAYAGRLAASTPRQRSRTVLGKYQIPPVGWRSYYVPADRYKFDKVWKYVSIEDDAGDYPVKYYYKPNSIAMLRLLSSTPHGGPLRANRVIGFRSWQDAMLAGYRPDPISRPEPAGDIAHLAAYTRSPQLARYVEYLYAGQVVPASHQYNMAYLRHVERIVNAHDYTRPLMGETLSQVLGAILGENPLPTSVGAGGRIAQISSTNPAGGSGATSGTSGTTGAPGGGLPSGAADKREEDFNKFGSNAGKLANVPANSH